MPDLPQFAINSSQPAAFETLKQTTPIETTTNPFKTNRKLIDAPSCTVIGADIPLNSKLYPIRELLDAFRGARRGRPDLRLKLAGRRDKNSALNIWNYIDEHKLTEDIEYLPYYDICRHFPIKKEACTLWVKRDTLSATLTTENLLAQLGSTQQPEQKLALFVTSFCPAKLEGNSTLMRQWLDHLRAAGYRIHLLYYALDSSLVTDDLRLASNRMADMMVEIGIETNLVGANRNGLNVHVDDWCGVELLEAVEQQTRHFEYDVALVNYSFLSACFDRVADYTRKILVTHDQFADRNRRMLAQGFPESGWLSLDQRGEVQAFRRADIVIALQEEEAESFRSIKDSTAEICVVAPIPEGKQVKTDQPTNKLRIGYLGSHNWVNEQNLVLFLEEWAKRHILVDYSELILAGGLCTRLSDFMSKELMSVVSPRMLGEVESLSTFFEQCDLFINPERGGTGIKIKTLDAMAHGVPTLTTRSGAVGIGTTSRFHLANDAACLADLVAECASDRKILETAKRETKEAFTKYRQLHLGSLERLLGPVRNPLHYKRQGTEAAGQIDVSENERQAEAKYHSVDFKKLYAQPKASIIIPFYNVEKYLEACILSVLEQNLKDIEIILVDDNSPDQSRTIANSFAAADKRIKIVTHIKNAGLGPARNTGVSHARGSYIFFLDSDDLLSSPEALNYLIRSAEFTGCQVVVGSCERLRLDGSAAEEDHQRDRQAKEKAGRVYKNDEAFIASIGLPGGYYLPMRSWGTLIKRSYYEELALDFPAGEHEDMAHVPFLYHKANGVFYDPLIAVKYREREQTLSNSQWTPEKFKRYADLWALIRKRAALFGLDKYIGDFAASFAAHLIWRVETSGYNEDANILAQNTLSLILQNLQGAENRPLLFNIIESLKQHPWDSLQSQSCHSNLTRDIPSWALIDFHREGLCLPALDSAELAQPPVKPVLEG